MSKKLKKILIFSFVILIVIIIALSVYLFFVRDSNVDRTAVIEATKTVITDYGDTQEIKYRMEVKDYKVSNIQKEIKYQSKGLANQWYSSYEVIKQYEEPNLELQQSGKKIIINLPIEYFKEEISYEDGNNIVYSSEGEKEEILNVENIKQLLQEQGYTIK